MQADIAIIGGTGVYDPKLLDNAQQVKVHTPYGPTSSPLVFGDFMGRKIVFLSRHGANHSIPPHKINFRANIWTLKEAGVKQILATCACGSLKQECKPGDIVIADQFVDFGRNVTTFYDEGKFYHVSFTEPFCPELRKNLISASEKLGVPFHNKGIYVKIDGPQFSTAAASAMYRQFGDIIGMTGVPEAILAREKEMCFAIIATITDYDTWNSKPVVFDEIKKVMAQNLDSTKRILEEVVPRLPLERSCLCKDALKGAEA